jgi:hypothetical protein
MAFTQRRPFRLRLLDPVLAEIALAGDDEGFDLVGESALGHGDEGNFGELAARNLAGCSNAIADFGQPENGISRQNLKAVPT